MSELNLRISCEGRLTREWLKCKTHFVNSVAVHTGDHETTFIDLVCREGKLKGSKGELLSICGFPGMKVYNGVPRFVIFVSDIYENEKIK